jgi:hypothetical protein
MGDGKRGGLSAFSVEKPVRHWAVGAAPQTSPQQPKSQVWDGQPFYTMSGSFCARAGAAERAILVLASILRPDRVAK